MTTRIDLSGATWLKSSYSNGDGGNCVEVADGVRGAVPVRDSKVPHGPALVFPTGSWGAFVDVVRNSEV